MSLRAIWEQGGQDPITARRVPSKYRETKGEQKGMEKGKQKARGLLYDCTIIYSCMYECLKCLNDTSYLCV